jgi:hypothetical protein
MSIQSQREARKVIKNLNDKIDELSNLRENLFVKMCELEKLNVSATECLSLCLLVSCVMVCSVIYDYGPRIAAATLSWFYSTK